MALILKDIDDATIKKLDTAINDERDGYYFDFIESVNSYRSLMADGKGIGVS